MSVTLDEMTDAGEFVYQQLHTAINDRNHLNRVQEVLVKEGVTAEEFARVVGEDLQLYDAILNGLNQWGMEFAATLDVETCGRAENALRNGERFVLEARKIVREAQ